MRRQGQYADAGSNLMMQPQKQPYPPPQQLSGNAYSTQDPLWPSDVHYSGALRHAEGQWHWDREAPKDPIKISSYPVGCTEGQGKAASHNYIYEAQKQDPKHDKEKVGNTEPKAPTPNNSALEGAYEDSKALPQTIDALEQRFLQDLTKLLKEQHDAEDAEFSRHHERLNDISAQYREKLVAMRAQQGKIRDEFLRKESESRYQQYLRTNSTAQFQNNTTPPSSLTSVAPHSYPPSSGGYSTEAPQRTALYSSYGAEGYPGGYRGDVPLHGTYPAPANRYESGSHVHGRGFESRYPGGRAYNAGGRQR